MGYFNRPVSISYALGSINFVGSPAAQYIRGPKGMTGRIREVAVSPSVAFTAVTTPAQITIGTAAAASAYATVSIPTKAVTEAFAASYDSPGWELNNDPIPADTAIKLAFVAPTGGSPAGTGLVTVVVDWF